MNEELKKFLEEQGFVPVNFSIFKTAFTHRSFLNESKEKLESNERLEFLGDSVLSFIVSNYLFSKRQNDAEGDLTNLRSYIVKTDSLARISQDLNLGEFLQMSKGEEASGGRRNPQLLANTFEALLGAVFIDQGLPVAINFVSTTLLPLFATEVQFGPPKDSKSQLQEVAQDLTKTAPRYKIIDTVGPDHAKKFKVGVFLNGSQIGEGSGNNKQQAEEEAAKKALLKLAENTQSI